MVFCLCCLWCWRLLFFCVRLRVMSIAGVNWALCDWVCVCVCVFGFAFVGLHCTSVLFGEKL